MLDYNGRTLARYQSEVPGVVTSQRKYELEELIKIYRLLKPKYVLEIGTQDGGTLYQWIKHAQPGAVICNIDILENQRDPHGTLERWHSWRRDDMELYSHIGRSQEEVAVEFVKAHMPRIDFLFIDGDHRYRGVKEDFINYGSMVKNGVIAFHDLMTPKSGFQNHITVGKLWREIQHVGYLTREIWCDADPDWGGIGVVYVYSHKEVSETRNGKGTVPTVRKVRQPGHLSEMRREDDTGAEE